MQQQSSTEEFSLLNVKHFLETDDCWCFLGEIPTDLCNWALVYGLFVPLSLIWNVHNDQKFKNVLKAILHLRETIV